MHIHTHVHVYVQFYAHGVKDLYRPGSPSPGCKFFNATWCNWKLSKRINPSAHDNKLMIFAKNSSVP